MAKGGRDVACNSQTSAVLLVPRIAGVPVGLAMIAVFTFLERHADAITDAMR